MWASAGRVWTGSSRAKSGTALQRPDSGLQAPPLVGGLQQDPKGLFKMPCAAQARRRARCRRWAARWCTRWRWCCACWTTRRPRRRRSRGWGATRTCPCRCRPPCCCCCRRAPFLSRHVQRRRARAQRAVLRMAWSGVRAAAAPHACALGKCCCCRRAACKRLCRGGRGCAQHSARRSLWKPS